MGAAWRKLRWNVAYWISRAGVAAGRYLPTGLCYAASVPIADACFALMRRHRRALEANLARVVGRDEAHAAARRVFRNFARYVIDFYQLPRRGREALQQRVAFDEWQALDEALDDPRGTLFVTLHLGQAELGGAALASYGHEVNAIAQTLDHAPMNQLIQGLRRDLGLKIIPARSARLGVLRCLRAGEVLALMFDSVEGDDTVAVKFFGETAQMSATPARIALRTGARLLTAVISRDPHNPFRLVPCVDFDLRFQPSADEEADVRRLSQMIAASLEGFVRRFPDQWFAFRPQWADTHAEQAPRANPAWKLWSLQAAVRLGAILPRPVAYAMARVAGDLAFRFRHGARADVEDNMRHVLGSAASGDAVRQTAREAFRNVARYYVDLVRLGRESREDLLAKVRLHGFDRLKSLLDAGQGVVVATAHYGNPEVAVQVGAVLGLDVLVLAEPLQPPAFADLMQRIRSTFGPRYEDVGFGAVSHALRHLRNGGCLAITCDRDIQGKGTPLRFFGRRARLPLGAVELAARTGAVLMPGYCRRRGESFDIYFEEPLPLVDSGRPKDDAAVNAERLLARAEEWIRADPGQWMVLERIWKPLPPQETPGPSQDRELQESHAG